uniref:Uncharacterized protein n=1 Tax=Meloidogyne incognita TaxID=6306 RepID=A0A914NFL8_MELIC
MAGELHSHMAGELHSHMAGELHSHMAGELHSHMAGELHSHMAGELHSHMAGVSLLDKQYTCERQLVPSPLKMISGSPAQASETRQCEVELFVIRVQHEFTKLFCLHWMCGNVSWIVAHSGCLVGCDHQASWAVRN